MSAEPEQDSEGCLFIIASYSDLASTVGPLAAEAAKRIMMSPTLGDFIELRFSDIGPRPERAGSTGHAAAVLMDELIHPTGDMGRNYFALVIADTSAATAERLLSDCAAATETAGLPVRLRGIASLEDRRPAPESDQAAEIVVSPAGSWSRDAFVDELRSCAEELLVYFATGYDPGLSRNELVLLRSGNEEDEVVPTPDILTPQVVVADPPDSRVPEEVVYVAEEPSREPEQPSPPRRSKAHWRPVVRWRRGHEAEPETGVEEPRISRLVYLIIISDDATWHRSRSILLDVDKKIAAMPLFASKVRMLQITQDGIRGALHPAGQLSRGDIRLPAGDPDFATVVGTIRTMLRTDRAAIQPAAWPAVIFFAADPPLADTVAVEAYQELAKDTSIIWVVSRESVDLVAPVFTEAAATLLLVSHQEVGDEIATLLTSGTRMST
jgi:hypothetical protein